MKYKLGSAVLAALLLTGCADDVSQNGIDTMSEGAAIPGSPEDFRNSVNDRVYFAYNQHGIDGEANAILAQQADWLKQYPNAGATIEGHADERGTREYNLALSEKRAMGAMRALQKHGVANALRTTALGKDRPVVEGNSEEARRANRVAITLID
jgi:peptidoglycan-associated lipoprotein